LKIAKVKPFYNKGDNIQLQTNMYLIGIFKNIGKANVKQINIFCRKNNILIEAQNGFREKKSTKTS